MLVTELRQWLAVYLSRDPAHLIFKKQYAEGGEEFDYVVKDTDRVENHLATASVVSCIQFRPSPTPSFVRIRAHALC
jgi:hypothetical protein